MQAAENIIQAHPDVNAIFASSDMMASVRLKHCRPLASWTT